MVRFALGINDASSSVTDDSSFRRRAVSGAGWVAADKWSNRFMGLITLAILGRLLTPEDFGLVALATAFMSFASVFVDQGLGRAIVQRHDLNSIYSSTTFWTSLASSVALGGVVALAAPFLASAFGGSAQLIPVIQVLALGLVVNALSSTPAALLERDFNFRSLAIRRFVGTMLGGVVAVVVALAGFGVWSLVLQSLVAGIAGVITLWAATAWRPRFEFSLSALKDLWHVGGSIIGMELVGLTNSQSDRLLIGAFLGPETLGYYFMAIRLVSIMVELFSSVFSGVSLTTFSRLQNDRPRLLAWFYKLTSLSSTTAIPVFTLAALTAPVLLPLLFGNQWEPSVILMQILCFLGALNAVAYFDRSVLIAVNRARSAFLLTLGQSIVGVILVLISLPFGVIFVALAVTLRQYAYWPMRLWTLKRNVGIDPLKYFLQWLRPFLLSLVAAGCVLALTVWVPGFWAANTMLYLILNVATVAIVVGGGVFLFNRSFYADVMRIFRRSV